jgi:hypothetical protein
MRGEQQILAFNRGMISRFAMARVDLKRYAMSADIQTNFMPRVLGSAMLRPGLGYIGGVKDDAAAKILPFVFAADDTALLELTDSSMRVWVDDAVITRPSVATAITNGDFTSNITDWSDEDAGSASSAWVTGGYMGLTGSGANSAKRRQAVTCSNIGTEHALRVVVARGVVTLLVGASAGESGYINATLSEGTHSLAFTPTGNFSIDVSSNTPYETLLDSINIEAAGVMVLPTPWTSALLPMVRKDQSGDVVFVACNGLQQRRIERRAVRSWSVVLYLPNDGPFMPINTTPITISNSSISGTTVLTSSAPVFRSGHVGALFRLESNGQLVGETITAENTFSNGIVVTGVGTNRSFNISVVGTFTATVTLQRSVGDTGVWEDTPTTYTVATSEAFSDGLDNQIVAYRIGVKTGDYTSGSIGASLSYGGGSITGVVRVTVYLSSTSVGGVVLSTLGTNAATQNWYEGYWSEYRGWPSAVALSEGRLWWAGKDKYFGSITDSFAGFDPDFEGDAGPIIRSIGSGPVDVINWLLPMQQLMAGTDGSVVSGRSSSFDEPLTPTNFNPKPTITQGCAKIAAVKLDEIGMFVQRGGYRVLSMEAEAGGASSSYSAENLSILVPDIGKPGIVAFDAQRQPDTRIHCVRSDGIAAVMVYDKAEDVKCWVLVETDGEIEDVCVLPADDEDAVYYVVKRVIGGVEKRYLERWAREDEAVGGTVNKVADSFATKAAGLSHLNGETVCVWDNGIDLGTAVVSGGTVTIGTSSAICGLVYEARFKSTKLAYLAQPGESGLPSRKRVHSLALVLADTHAQGVQYGRDFDDMDDLPLMEAYQVVDPDSIWEEYNYEAFSLPGAWGVDERLCLKATAPKPCTLLAAVVGLVANSTT